MLNIIGPGEKCKETTRYHFTLTKRTVIKLVYNNKCWDNVDKLEFLCTGVENVKWCNILENRLEIL